jgi:hypothetical protein
MKLTTLPKPAFAILPSLPELGELVASGKSPRDAWRTATGGFYLHLPCSRNLRNSAGTPIAHERGGYLTHAELHQLNAKRVPAAQHHLHSARFLGETIADMHREMDQKCGLLTSPEKYDAAVAALLCDEDDALWYLPVAFTWIAMRKAGYTRADLAFD